MYTTPGALPYLQPAAIDDGWYRWVTSFAQHSTWLQSSMRLYTTGGVVLLALMAVYAWWRARADRAAMVAVVWLGLGTLVSVGAGAGLKLVFRESRPCRTIHLTTVEACPGPTDYSFPSSHTTIAAALAVGLWLVNRRLGIVAAVLAAVEAFSRVYLGQHYPHDVLGASALSVVIMLLGWVLLRRPLARLIEILARTPVRPLLSSAAPEPD